MEYIDLFDFYLPHVTDEAKIQLYSRPEGGRLGQPTRVSTRQEIEDFKQAHRDKHVYFNVGLMAEPPQGKRGGNEHCRLMPGFFADLDTCEGVHAASEKLPTLQQVAEMLNSEKVVPKPSEIIFTGGGFHIYWQFGGPWKVKDPKQLEAYMRNLEGLNDQILAWSQSQGFKYDRLKDPCRILRVPGTYNHKTKQPKLVKTLWPKDGARPKQFLIDALYYEPAAVEEKEHVDLSEFDESDIIQEALRRCTKVEAVWGGDGSGYLIKLCRQCVQAGCSEEQACKVIQSVLDLQPNYPTKWKPQQIARRYKDALTQSTLGEGIAKRREYPDTGFDVAKRLAEKANGEFFYVAEWNKWASWDGKKFAVDGLSKLMKGMEDVVDDLKDEIEKMLREGQIDDKTANSLRSQAKGYLSPKGLRDLPSVTREYIRCSFRDLDADKRKFHCQNAVLQLNEDGSFEQLDHSRWFKNTLLAGAEYQPDATCPRWDQFCTEVFVGDDGLPDPELAKYMQKIAGLCLTGMDVQSLFIMFGEGRNGKGVFSRTMCKLLGEYSRSVGQQVLMAVPRDHPTALVGLFRRRAVFASETDQDCRLNENQVKMLTGGDTISARRMREDFWEFEPTHKIFLSTNHLPIIRGTDGGIWRRVKLCPFNACFDGLDTELEEVHIPKGLPGILNWALEGYRLYATEGLTEPPIVQRAINEYRKDMNIVGQFVDENCELGEEFREVNGDVYQAYKFYCQQNSFPVRTSSGFGRELKKMGLESRVTNGKRYRFGIRLSSEFDDYPENQKS
ncbi:MAG TPA: hypothetical protein DDW52_04040 [Planctomycetaceae bacterium]|nr:hypothetical protein [Planctomycetaceae bacterium]